MVAVVQVDTRPAAKGNRATEEGKTPPPPPDARRKQQPTPDHPPYCWMIGEAIDGLGEDGGSAEGCISGFIRARHAGVPAAHDRLLRHYLAKHVAEGFFVCTAPGRYARSPDEAAVVEAPGSSVVVCVGSPVTQAKRGRGRPRKDGSSSTSPAGKKDGSVVAPPATPKRRGRRPRAAPLAADEGSVPTSSIAVAGKKDESQATSSTPRRRRGLRKLAVATTTDGPGEALVTDKKDGIGAPSTTEKEHGRSLELALMIVGHGTATTSIEDKVCGEASPTTPVDSGQPREVVRATADVPALTPTMDKDGGEAPSLNLAPVAKHGDIPATSASPELSSQACELALVVADDSSVPVSIVGKEDGGEAPSAAYKRRRQSPRKAAPVAVAAHGSAPASTPAKKAASGKALSAAPKGRRRQRKPALVATGNRSAPAIVAGRKTGNEVPFATPKLTLVTAGGSSTPASVADKNDGDEAPAVVPKSHGLPHKLYPLTAGEVPDDPLFCLLALPACKPAVANA